MEPTGKQEPGQRGRLAFTTTEAHGISPLAGLDVRLPGLTVLYHPDLTRIGERVLLTDLEAGPVELSRTSPAFVSPGGFDRRPLDDTRLSRRPVRLSLDGPNGSIVCDASKTPSHVEVDGSAVTDRIEIDRASLAGGRVILLGSQIVLLLHLLDPAVGATPDDHGLIGESPDVHRLRRDIERVADLAVPVLLLGETGTGKELVSRAVHRASPRARAPFVAVNMASIPSSLAASELFGTRKGAYTGAVRSRQGYFERADGGTLFLDEIGDTPSDVQPMLLRTLETGEVVPVGSETSIRPSVRLVSATDADLTSAIEDGRFRAPVLHRLSGFVIQLPALRDRREDFGRLLVYFLREQADAVGEAARLRARQPWLPAPLVARLARWHWPGNVRQLRNTVRQLVIAHRGVDRMSLPTALEALLDQKATDRTPRDDREVPRERSLPATRPRASKPRRAGELSDDELRHALSRHGWDLQATAEHLGVSRPALYHRIKQSKTLRTAADLRAEAITTALAEAEGDDRAAAEALQVSLRALRRRINQLGLAPKA